MSEPLDEPLPEDRDLRTAIMNEQDPETLVQLIYAFYRDADRADRTPRETLYLHLGLLSGVIMRLLNARDPLALADVEGQ